MWFTRRHEEDSARGEAGVHAETQREGETQRGKLPSRLREGLGVGAEPPRARMGPVPSKPTTNARVQPRPAGGRPEAPPGNLDRVGQRGELGATVLGRATDR